MNMVIEFVLLIVGLGILWGGAELFVKGASNIAIGLGVRPLVVGLTVVAMGTSSPEFAVSLLAALTHTKDLSLANIIGSNIANIGLVIGVSAMIRPLRIERSIFRSEVPIVLIATIIFSVLSWNGVISAADGVLLLTGFIVYLIFMVNRSLKDRTAAKQNEDFVDLKKNPKRFLVLIMLIVAGFVGLVLGSYFIVDSAKIIADFLGVTPFVIGISVVAVGTSLPELAISAVGAARGQVDLAVGNAIGSNVFNTLFVIASVAVITPLPVEHSLFQLHFPALIFFTLLIIPMMWTRFRLTRIEGAILFIFYIVFVRLMY